MKIRECVKMTPEQAIQVMDVLQWSINETFLDTRRSMPLWAVQGECFVRQQLLWPESSPQSPTVLSTTDAVKFLEDEAVSLEQRYSPRSEQSNATLSSLHSSQNMNLIRIANRCRDFDNLEFNSNTLREEQERELSPEIQQERHIEHPAPAEAATPSLHPDVRIFWSKARLHPGSEAYMPAFQALKGTSAAADFDVMQFKDTTLLATADFVNTVKKSAGESPSDQYQRHVQWLLSRCSKNIQTVEQLLIISPFEANQLRERTDRSPKITMHLYKAQSNRNYAPLDKLDLHTIPVRDPALQVPRALIVQLNLFASQLYIESNDDYLEICNFLGIAAEAITAEMAASGWGIAADGFIMTDDNGKVGGDSGLVASPLKFIKTLMTKIRRNGEGIDRTDMGSLLEGKILARSHFQN